MKLLLDTAMPKLMMLLIKEDKVIDSVYFEDQKKADALPGLYQELMNKHNLKTINIKEFYVTKGPGSFMGARTALTFVRTITQITNAKLFLIDTLKLYSKNKAFYLDAKSNQSFYYDSKNDETKIVDFQENTLIDYDYISENISLILSHFVEVIPSDAKANYIKEPKIGGGA